MKENSAHTPAVHALSNGSGKSVGIWIRVSTEDQVRGESPETHEKRARLVAEAKGWSGVEVYRLDAVSGKTVKEHPETKRMLLDVKKGHISGLIFSKQDIENYINELHLVPQNSFFEPCDSLEIVRRALRNLIMSFEKMGEHAKAEEVKLLLVEISDGGDLGV